jgi:hypothetical protein
VRRKVCSRCVRSFTRRRQRILFLYSMRSGGNLPVRSHSTHRALIWRRHSLRSARTVRWGTLPISYSVHCRCLPALLCVFTGQGISKSSSVRGNLFGCLIGPRAQARRTIEGCLTKLEYEFPWTVKRRYPGSEHGLMLILEGKKPKDLTALDNISKPFLGVQYEMRSTFGKMGIDNRALPFAFNHLFYLDEYGTENQKGGMICYAKLSIFGGLTAENPEEFAEVFGKLW